MPDSLTPAGVRERREKTIARLCEHFARDHIEASDLERLIDRAHEATTVAQLDALTAGLPALTAPEAQRQVERWKAPAGGNEVVIAVMGGAERRGAWTPARRMQVTAVMGGVVLDFRVAQLGPGVTEIFVVAIMGGVEIIIPPEVAVESNGIGIMGGFSHDGHRRFPVDGSGPVLRITGLALMGGVDVREQPSRGHGGPDRQLSQRERHRLERGEPRDGAGWVDRAR
ncbi:MAG: DUF1707 domain-containing protein [Gemmatimonadetes bacterium]|nr:DUF1707 domain-containing protein [Gemmatimonadota bacterium]